MSIREDYLSKKLGEYLQRRTMPRGFESKPAARDAELQALVRCMVRYAPRERYDDWWVRMEDRLAEDAKTRAWPTEGEIKSAAMDIRPSNSKGIAETGDVDTIQINVDRIQNGQPVGDGYLWGKLAVEVMQRGVSLPQIRAYRSAIYFSEKAIHGEEVARQKEQEREVRHQIAEDIARQRAAMMEAAE